MATISEPILNTQEVYGDNKPLICDITRKALERNFSGSIQFAQGDYIYGEGNCTHLGDGNIRLTISRFIMTQEKIELELECLKFRGHPIHMEGQVLDCYPDANGKDFVAMMHVEV